MTKMKVIHIEGGLGNQMAAYAVYVAAVASNPNDLFYIDTYIYEIKEAHSTISMWNGYELNTVFGVNILDIRKRFTPKQVQEQLDFLRRSEFWKHDWNYAEVFIEMMKKYGIQFESAYNSVGETPKGKKSHIKYALKKYMAGASKNRLAYECKHFAYKEFNRISADVGKYLYCERKGDIFYDLTLDFMKSQFLCDTIGEEVRKGLSFNIPEDKENQQYLELVRNCNSVSVHVRRTDYLQFNEDCYRFGYFKKSTRYIRKQVSKPVFFIFSDDLNWCEENLEIIGLSKNDKLYFVGINQGMSSYRDMQIIANCKHNIATKSSFGWWGSFLNSSQDKITCIQFGNYIASKMF